MGKAVYKAHYCYYIAAEEELNSGKWLENSIGKLRWWWNGRRESSSFATAKKRMEEDLHVILSKDASFTGAAMIWDLRGEWIVFHWYDKGQRVSEEPPSEYAKNWRFLSWLKE